MWERAHSNLAKRSVPCPSCQTVHAAIPEQVDGKVIDLEHSNASNPYYTGGRYPAFIPADIHIPGYAVVRCSVCGTRFVAEFSYADHALARVVWPLPNVVVSVDVPEPVRSAIIDAKRAHAADSITGAVMSLRTGIERIQRQQEAGSLSELWDKTHLPPNLFDAANEPRLWGYLVAHVDFSPEAATREQVAELITFVDLILELIYGMPAKLERARKDRKQVEKPNKG